MDFESFENELNCEEVIFEKNLILEGKFNFE